MKLNNAKGYIIGSILGASLMFSAQSFAEDGLTEIKALLRTGLNITLNGAKVALDNPSINYNGSTYIKLRDAGKLTGTGVLWNEKTQTVEMSSVGSSQGKVDTLSGANVKNEVAVSPSPMTQSIPAPTPNVEMPAVLKGDDDVFISQKDIFLEQRSRHNEITTFGAKNGKYIVTNDGKDYIAQTNLNTFYDLDTEIQYFSKTFLSQIFPLDYLNQFDKYSINFTKKLVNKIQ